MCPDYYAFDPPPGPNDEWRGDDEFSLQPPAWAPAYDVASQMLRETREDVARELEELGIFLGTPGTAIAKLAQQAAASVSAPKLLLTKAVTSGRPNKNTPREPMFFGAEFPNGTMFPSTGGFTLVLSPQGPMIYGREIGSRAELRPLLGDPTDISPYARLMAAAGITSGMIIEEFRLFADGHGDRHSQLLTEQEFSAIPIAPEFCCSRLTNAPKLSLPDSVCEKKVPSINATPDKAPAPRPTPVAKASPPAIEDRTSRMNDSSVRSSIAQVVVGISGIPVVLSSFLTGNPGYGVTAIFVAGLLVGACIHLSGRRSSSRR